METQFGNYEQERIAGSNKQTVILDPALTAETDDTNLAQRNYDNPPLDPDDEDDLLEDDDLDNDLDDDDLDDDFPIEEDLSVFDDDDPDEDDPDLNHDEDDDLSLNTRGDDEKYFN